MVITVTSAVKVEKNRGKKCTQKLRDSFCGNLNLKSYLLCAEMFMRFLLFSITIVPRIHPRFIFTRSLVQRLLLLVCFISIILVTVCILSEYLILPLLNKSS